MHKKNIFSKLFSFFLVLLFCFFTIAIPVKAANQEVNVYSDKEINLYFFWANGCPHCKEEKKFLEKIKEKYDDNINILSFEVTSNRANIKLFKEVGKKLDANVSSIPFTVIGEKYIVGWHNEASSGIFLESIIKDALEHNCSDVVMNLIDEKDIVEANNEVCAVSIEDKKKTGLPEKIRLPLFGDIEIKNFSLPFLTIVVGALDGFNPCAMWVLLFLITLLLGMKDKKRMWILGTVFISVSAFVYFLFMSAWLNLFLFLGFIFWVRIMIAIVALFSGGYYLKDYFTNKAGVCKVTGNEKRKKIFDRLKDITHKKQFLFALAGIIVLAFAVNLVELICSAGLPAVYTQILSLSDLARWQYYLYLLLYIVVFMLDDLVVFFMAMITLRTIGVSGKYSRISRLVGGIIMVIIGILMLFQPGWLMFG
ncbi:TlpA family protein disulfide reductase [Patescibacteria group bacterium]